jgi:hypothetical protein
MVLIQQQRSVAAAGPISVGACCTECTTPGMPTADVFAAPTGDVLAARRLIGRG